MLCGNLQEENNGLKVNGLAKDQKIEELEIQLSGMQALDQANKIKFKALQQQEQSFYRRKEELEQQQQQLFESQSRLREEKEALPLEVEKKLKCLNTDTKNEFADLQR